MNQSAFQKISRQTPKTQEGLNELKQKIDAMTSAIRISLDEYDKLIVLAAIGVELIKRNELIESSIGIETSYTETDHILEPVLEYCLNIALVSANTSNKVPQNNYIIGLIDDVHNIMYACAAYRIGADLVEKNISQPNFSVFQTYIQKMFVRGLSYDVHWKDFYNFLFLPHEEKIINSTGLSVSDFYTYISRTLDLKIISKIMSYKGLLAAYERFKEWPLHIPIDIEKREHHVLEYCQGTQFMEKFLEDNPDLRDEKSKDNIVLIDVSKSKEIDFKRIFWIVPQTKKEEDLLNKLSCNFGDNGVFANGEFGLFPLSESILSTKPIVKVDDKFYCFNALLPYRNVQTITWNLIKQCDPTYYNQVYLNNKNKNSKDVTFENIVFQTITSKYKAIKSLQSLHYTDSDGNRSEMDMILVLDNVVVFIEMKANALSDKDVRFSGKGVQDKLDMIIADSFHQSTRALNVCKNNKHTTFDSSSGEIEVSQTCEFFRLSIAIEHLSGIFLDEKNLVDDRIISEQYKGAIIWSVYDLMAIVDILENEADFIDYLRFRVLFANTNIVHNDELSVLEMFLSGENIQNLDKADKVFILDPPNLLNDYFYSVSMGLPHNKPKRC